MLENQKGAAKQLNKEYDIPQAEGYRYPFYLRMTLWLCGYRSVWRQYAPPTESEKFKPFCDIPELRTIAFYDGGLVRFNHSIRRIKEIGYVEGSQVVRLYVNFFHLIPRDWIDGSKCTPVRETWHKKSC